MQYYIALIAAILLANSLPAFAPPTWVILVFFLINYDLNPYALVILGVLSATAGRGFLAWYFRRFAHLVPTRFSKNMEYAGRYFQKDSGKKYAVIAIFLISPISSAQLFEAAGLMKTVALKPLLAAFAVGRTISYSTYVTGAAAIAATDFGDVIVHELRSPWAIGTQIALILGLVLLGNVDWKKRLKR
jgi:uncharacterized membrane protein YdjX (TVP38/TMEM64 family)